MNFISPCCYISPSSLSSIIYNLFVITPENVEALPRHQIHIDKPCTNCACWFNTTKRALIHLEVTPKS